jgi:hypothetical protein
MTQLVQIFGTRLRTAGANRLFQARPLFSIPGNAVALATFVLEGTGAPNNSIALFGHAFPQGDIPENAPVLLRRQDTDDPLRTQMNVLTRWPDNSVKTALLAAEMPFVADTATLGVRMVVGETHPNPGPDLNLATLLAGRTVVVKTWAPGNTTTPLWTFNAHANVGTDRWRQGPLAISTRVVTPVPPSAVQNTSGATGTIESVRLIVDITVTKDGYIEADVCFANDRVMHPNGGIARFGYTIEIDGEVLYDQRPSTGPARDLLQYSNWIRRVGRNADGSIKTGRGHPREELFYFRPDFDVLVDSGVQLAFDRSMPLDPAHKQYFLVDFPGPVDANHNDPYYNWSLYRSAGAVGGRAEIGYRAYSNAVWLRDGDRLAIRMAMRDFEAGATRHIYYYDWELDRWVNPVDWPKMSLPGISSPAGTPRATATGLPSNQLPTHNETDHITVDHAHHGSHNWTPALLAGRRLCYDSLAARSAWAVMNVTDKANGVLGSNNPNWRTLTPDHTTGRAWAVRPWSVQIRSWAWDLRDIVDCAVILPDNYPNRLFYTRNAEAMFNSLKDVLPTIRSMFPPVLGLPMIHGEGDLVRGYMYSFIFYGAVTAARTGVGGPNMPEIVREFLTFRVNSMMDGGVPYRNAMTGGDLQVRGSTTGPYNAQSWADVWAKTTTSPANGGRGLVPVPPDWSVGTEEGDYQRNVLASFSFSREIPNLPLDLQAKLADALVLARSERQAVNNHPRLAPEIMNGAFFMSNSVTARGIVWRWDYAPTIVQGQSFQVDGGAQFGAIIGVVRFTGPVPRNGEPGLTPATPAWEIVSQPPGNPFTISMGGVLKLAGNPPAAGTSQVVLRCRTYNGNSNTPLISDPVAVEVVTTAVAAQITNIAPASPQDVIEGVPVGTAIYTVTVRGNAPITPSITSGNTALFEFVYSSGNDFVVRTRAPLTGAIGTYPLTLRVENAHGSDTANVSIGVVANAQPAIITPGQTVTLFESLTPREAEQPIAYTGDPPSSAIITAGDGGVLASPLTITGSTVRLFSSAPIRRRLLSQLTPTIQMLNAANFDNPSSATVTVNIAHPWVHRTVAPSVVYIGVWSIARRVVSTYTGPLIRIRRASDNAEQDIGFVESGGHHVLDESAVTSFVGSSDWFIRTIYDQSLEGVNLEQTNTSLQPIGGTAGGFNRIGSNNRVAAQFGSNRRLAGTFSTLPVNNMLGVMIGGRTATITTDWQRPMSMVRGGTDDTNFNMTILSDGKPRVTSGNQSFTHSTALTANQTFVLYGRFLSQISHPDRWRIGFTGQPVQNGSGGNTALLTDTQEIRIGNTFLGRLSEVVLIREIPAGPQEADLYNAMGAFFGV